MTERKTRRARVVTSHGRQSEDEEEEARGGGRDTSKLKATKVLGPDSKKECNVRPNKPMQRILLRVRIPMVRRMSTEKV
jgi:hypothetical protein